MARYWVGGSGNWSDTAHWSATRDGAGGQTVPTSADSVYISKSPSADQIINIDMDVEGQDFNIQNAGTGTYPYTIDFNEYSFTLYGYNSLEYQSVSAVSSIDFTNSYIKTPFWQLWDGATGTNLIMTGSTVHVISYGHDSSEELPDTDVEPYFVDDRTDGDHIYNNLVFEMTYTNSIDYLLYDHTHNIICENLTFITPSAGSGDFYSYSYEYGGIGNTIVNGDITCTSSIERNSRAFLHGFNLIKTSGDVIFENCTLTNCTAYGGAYFMSNTSYGNIDWTSDGINEGWDFTDTHERYWIGNGGDWNDRSHWSLTSGGTSGCAVPTINDDVFFDSNSITLPDQTITTIGTSLSKSLSIKTEYPIIMKGGLLETTSSNLCSGGVSSANEWYIGIEGNPNNVFDNDPNTYWWVNIAPLTIYYDFGIDKTVVRYYIKDSDWRWLIDWTFEGSHDTVNWYVLDTQTGHSGNIDGTFFSISNRTGFRYYRLNITNCESNSVILYDFKMYDQPSSNICVGGTATASEWDAGYYPEYAFDGSMDTEWYYGYSNTPGWLKYDLGEGNEKIALSYALTQWDASYGYYASDWTFEGSNDDITWDILDTQTGQYPSGSEMVTILYDGFINETPYRYYRLNITGGGVDMWWLDIIEFVINGQIIYPTDTYYTLTVPEDDILMDNICVGGVATASIENVGYTAEKAFDSDIHTSWYYWEGNEPGWLKYDLGEGNEQIALRYILTLYNNDGPSDWTFEGSNDDINWDILDTQTNRPYVNNDDQISLTFNISNDIPYRYYRINITDGVGGRWLHIIELEIKSNPYEIPIIVKGIDPELIQYTTLIDSYIVPSGSVYEYYHVIDGGGNDGWTFIPAPQEEYTFTNVQGNHTISVNFIWYEIQEDMHELN